MGWKKSEPNCVTSCLLAAFMSSSQPLNSKQSLKASHLVLWFTNDFSRPVRANEKCLVPLPTNLLIAWRKKAQWLCSSTNNWGGEKERENLSASSINRHLRENDFKWTWTRDPFLFVSSIEISFQLIFEDGLQNERNTRWLNQWSTRVEKPWIS